MNRLLPILAALLLCASAQATRLPRTHAGKALPFAVQSETLPNGLRVVTVPLDSRGLVAYYTLVRVGSRNEVEPGKSGFAHFFEHMMFAGTAKHPAEKVDQLVSQLGLDTNAFTEDDITVYHFSGPTRALPTIIEMEADRFQHLAYTKPAFQTEAKAVLGEYNKSMSDPTEKMDEVMHDTAFTLHTYKHTTIGFLKDIQAMPEQYDYSLDFFRRYYRPDNCVLFVIGDFKRAETMAKIRKEYASWSGHVDAQTIAAEPQQTGERVAFVDWKSETKPRVLVGYHTPEAGTKEAATASVLSAYLFDKSGPLYKELVIEKQLAEQIDGDASDHRDPQLFEYLLTLRKKGSCRDDKVGCDGKEARAAVERAIAKVTAGEVDAERLRAVKDHLHYSLLMHLETPDQVAHALVVAVGETGQLDAIDRKFDQMAQVTAADVTAYAKRFLTDGNRTVVTLRPNAKVATTGSRAAKAGGAR